MNIQIITPDKTVYAGEVTLVQLPGLDGSFEILNNHAPIISALKAGAVKVKTTDEQILFFDILGGIVEVLNNKVMILAE
jgi:F-type H+-transporting ATPase subunit epsilon